MSRVHLVGIQGNIILEIYSWVKVEELSCLHKHQEHQTDENTNARHHLLELEGALLLVRK